MNKFFDHVEAALSEYAVQYTPEGSEVKSVIHQWVQAIAYKHELFGETRGANKDKVIEILKSCDVFGSQDQFIRDVNKSVHIKPLLPAQFTFIDLFAGIGGIRQGFESVGGSCVFTSEYDKHAQRTYWDNFGEYPFGDITKIANDDLGENNWVDAIPNHDVLTAGFPCQPFSHAGLKLGIEDTRGTLFDNIAQILQAKKPKFALLENVKGLISHDQGHTLKTILRKLVHMGYTCTIPNDIIFGEDAKKLKEMAKKMVLRSRDFGLPQNRQRIYIVLWRNDQKVDFIYPEPRNIKTRVGDILESEPDEKYTISDRLWAGHQRRKINNKKNGKGFGYGIVTHESPYTNTISARYYKDGSECLVEQESNKNPRKITPKEASRLQGFNNDFIINPSDVQAYKQFGNSVSVPVIYKIAEGITKTLGVNDEV